MLRLAAMLMKTTVVSKRLHHQLDQKVLYSGRLCLTTAVQWSVSPVGCGLNRCEPSGFDVIMLPMIYGMSISETVEVLAASRLQCVWLLFAALSVLGHPVPQAAA